MNIDSANLITFTADPSLVEGTAQGAAISGEADNAFGEALSEQISLLGGAIGIPTNASGVSINAPGMQEPITAQQTKGSEKRGNTQATPAGKSVQIALSGEQAPADKSEELLNTFNAMRQFIDTYKSTPAQPAENSASSCSVSTDTDETESESIALDAGSTPAQEGNNSVISEAYTAPVADDSGQDALLGKDDVITQTEAGKTVAVAQAIVGDGQKTTEPDISGVKSGKSDKRTESTATADAAPTLAVWLANGPMATDKPIVISDEQNVAAMQPLKSSSLFQSARVSDSDQQNKVFAQTPELPSSTLQNASHKELPADKTPGPAVGAAMSTPSEIVTPGGTDASALPVEGAVAAPAAEPVMQKAGVEAKEVPALTKHISQPGWDQDVGERIIWMHSRSINAAEIKVNPQHLGPVSVRVDVNQDQASIVFTAHNGAVKEALEASIPKLREMMSTQQLDLVNVSVSQQFSPEQGGSQQQTFERSAVLASPFDGAAETDIKEEPVVTVTQGLLSLYA